MKLDQNRLERQKEGLSKWKAHNYTGTLEWATGTGKTFAAILAIKHLKNHIKSDLKVIVSVPTDNLRTQWRDLLAKFNLSGVYVDTVHTLITSNHEVDFFILDEIHSYTGGDEFSRLFDCVKRSYILGLTAKEQPHEKDRAVISEHCPVVDKISIADALESGFISPFVSYNLGLQFSESDQRKYQRLNRDFHKYFSTFGHDFDLAMSCLGSSELRKKVANDVGMSEADVNIHTFQFNRVMQKRKKYLYNADILVETTKAIIEKFDTEQIITFSESTAMADRLEQAIPDSKAYHSNLSTILIDGKKFGATRLKRQILADFKEGKLLRLHAARALNMGQDIPAIGTSIKTSFNSTIIDAIQRLGRIVRKQPDKLAKEINLYIIGTKSENWLRRSQVGLPNIKWINSIDEIV